MERNLSMFGPFAASERVLMALGKAGADRQAMHERLRQHALAAWESVQAGGPNPLLERFSADPEILRYLDVAQLRGLMDVSSYLGDAPRRARSLASELRTLLDGE